MAVAGAQLGTVTVLFTDLVGSTALRARIGEEAADQLRVKHDTILSDAITTRGGVVVKNTGDGVMATFAAAANAVAAAVAVQQAVDGHNRRSPDERLEVRVGMSVGDVTAADGDYFGLPVIEAQRLEAAANGGQILCADIVCRLARGRGGHEFVDVGDLVLKGIPEPVPTMEIRWEPVVQVAMSRETPLPSVLSGPRNFELAGRDEVLEQLAGVWKEAAAGRRQVVLLSGEPGVGKTRLAVETALVAHEQGALVLAGRCDEELALPYQPFAEALRFQVSLEDAPLGWLGPLSGELTRLMPELTDGLTGTAAQLSDDLDFERTRLYDAITAWLRTTAASVPVLLVLDDLQWADRPTLHLLRHVVRETPNESLCIFATLRSTELDDTQPISDLIMELRREGAVALSLEPLTADGVTDFVEHAAGHELDEAGLTLAAALFDETNGNPFFVGELVRHLVESGKLIMRDGRWTSHLAVEEFGLPDSVREVIGARVSRLDDDAQRVLAVAAVIGHQFSLPVLASVVERGEDQVLDELDAARAAGLVDEIGVDAYRFGHALVRGTLLAEQTTTRRVRAHRKIAETLERLHVDNLEPFVADLAYHWGETAASDPDKALHYAIRAGQRADDVAAPDDAVRWYTHALELTAANGGDVAMRVDVLTRLGQAVWASGTGDPREHLRAAARLARDAGLWHAMADALLVRVRQSYYQWQESDPEKIALLEQVIERLGDEPALRARTMSALASELVFVGDRSRRGPLLDQARELAIDSGDPVAIVDVASRELEARPHSALTAGYTRKLQAYGADALGAARSLGDPQWIFQMLVLNGVTAVTLNDGDRIRSNGVALDDVAGVNPYATMLNMVVRQMLAVMEGRLVEADALCNEMMQTTRGITPHELLAYSAMMQLAVRREQARLSEIIPGWGLAPQTPPVTATMAFLLAETAQYDDAAMLVTAASRREFEDIADDLSWSVTAGMWAEAAVLVYDRDAAAKLHSLHSPFDELLCATGGINCGPTARLLALLEDVLDRPDDADRHFADAVEQSRSLISPVWIARCQLDWASCLLARNDTQGARELIDDADATIGTLMLPALQQQAMELRTQLSR